MLHGHNFCFRLNHTHHPPRLRSCLVLTQIGGSLYDAGQQCPDVPKGGSRRCTECCCVVWSTWGRGYMLYVIWQWSLQWGCIVVEAACKSSSFSWAPNYGLLLEHIATLYCWVGAWLSIKKQEISCQKGILEVSMLLSSPYYKNSIDLVTLKLKSIWFSWMMWQRWVSEPLSVSRRAVYHGHSVASLQPHSRSLYWIKLTPISSSSLHLSVDNSSCERIQYYCYLL